MLYGAKDVSSAVQLNYLEVNSTWKLFTLRNLASYVGQIS
jgi:hypothetical protein